MPAEASIGSLVVNVLGNVGGFVRGMKKGEKRLSAFQKHVQKSEQRMKSFRRALTALGTGFAATRLVGSLRETAQELDDIAKTGARLGIATQQLSGLQFAAQQTGVDTRTLNMALQRMTRRVSEAAKGTGEAKGALEELGLDARQLNKLRPDQVFVRVAQAMSHIPDQSDKVRIAFKLFDSEGAKLVQTLDLGVRGLADMQRQAESLGIAISEDKLARVEKFNDAMNTLSNLIGGFGKEILIDIAPAATKAVNTLKDAIAAIREIDEGLRKGAGGEPARQLFFAQKELESLSQFLFGIGSSSNLRGVTRRATEKAIRDDIAKGKLTEAGPGERRERRAVTAHQQRVMDAMIERDRRRATTPDLNRRLTGALNSLFDPSVFARQAQKFAAKRDELIVKAQKFGQRQQRDLIAAGILQGGPAFAGAGGPSIADQGRQARTLREIFERGLKDGFEESGRDGKSLEKMQREDSAILKRQLSAQERTAKAVERIEANQGQVQIIEGGL